jgi:CRISPR system Cascade subunit CasB
LGNENEIKGFVSRKIVLLDANTSWARGMCAKLRRGIGKAPGELPDIWEITLSDAPEAWDSKNGVATFEQNAVHTALTLYALHRQGKNSGMSLDKGESIGGAVGRLAAADGSSLEAVKRRFDAVVTATGFLELAHHVRGVVQLLKAADIKLDYPRFASDLYYYQLPSSTSGVKLRWGQDFYGTLGKNNDRKEDNEL